MLLEILAGRMQTTETCVADGTVILNGAAVRGQKTDNQQQQKEQQQSEDKDGPGDYTKLVAYVGQQDQLIPQHDGAGDVPGGRVSAVAIVLVG